MKLADFQKIFLKSISNDHSIDLESLIKPAGSLNAQQAIQVYRGDYKARLSEAIGELYESIWYVLGDEDFFNVAKDYIDTHPSTVKELGSYAQDFPQYLKAHPLVEDFPFLSQLAEFEQTFWQLFHQEETQVFDPFIEIDASELGQTKFKMPDHCRLFSWPWSIDKIFEARSGENEQEINWDVPSSCMLVKLNQKISIFNLSENQYKTLINIAGGCSIESSLEGSAEEISSLFSLLRTQMIPLRKISTGA